MSISISIWHLSKRERSQTPFGCQNAIFADPLTAFFPWSWQLLQVLHSMHCHHRALTRAVSSGENLRQDGWPAGRQTGRQKRKTSESTLEFFFRHCWLTAVTHLHHCRRKKWLLLELKPSLNQTWLQRECSNINDNLSELCFCSVWGRANKTALSGKETRWGKNNLSSAFTRQCQAFVWILQLLAYRESIVSQMYWTQTNTSMCVYSITVFVFVRCQFK